MGFNLFHFPGSNKTKPLFQRYIFLIKAGTMKQWFKWIPVGVALLIFSALEAQPGPLNREKIRAELQLRPDQEARFFDAMKKSAGAMRSLRSNTVMEPTQRRAEAKKIAEAHRTEIASILSKEQMDKWTAMRGEHMRRQGNRPPLRGRGQGSAMQGGRPVPNKELVQAIRAYSEKEILPVLKKERASFEKQMSSKDQEALASLRTQVKAMGNPGGMRRPSPPPGGSQASKNPELDRLAEKYRTEINRIFARMEPQVDRWNKDLRALHEKYAKSNEGPGSRKGVGPIVPSAARFVHPKRFLLLDPRT